MISLMTTLLLKLKVLAAPGVDAFGMSHPPVPSAKRARAPRFTETASKTEARLAAKRKSLSLFAGRKPSVVLDTARKAPAASVVPFGKTYS